MTLKLSRLHGICWQSSGRGQPHTKLSPEAWRSSVDCAPQSLPGSPGSLCHQLRVIAQDQAGAPLHATSDAVTTHHFVGCSRACGLAAWTAVHKPARVLMQLIRQSIAA